jgi:hypothetical protein
MARGIPMQNRVRLCEVGSPDEMDMKRINSPKIIKNRPILLMSMGAMINEMGETSNDRSSHFKRDTWSYNEIKIGCTDGIYAVSAAGSVIFSK